MKTTIFQPVVCILVIAATFLYSCKKEYQIVSGFVSGTVKVYDPSTPLVKYPVSGIKVYLGNADFNAYWVNSDNNKAAIIDSVLTDTYGKYQFAELTEGNYSVVPVTGSVQYLFVLEDAAIPQTIAINNNTSGYTVNFMAQIPDHLLRLPELKLTSK
jgi:hypothetical protein